MDHFEPSDWYVPFSAKTVSIIVVATLFDL